MVRTVEIYRMKCQFCCHDNINTNDFKQILIYTTAYVICVHAHVCVHWLTMNHADLRKFLHMDMKCVLVSLLRHLAYIVFGAW